MQVDTACIVRRLKADEGGDDNMNTLNVRSPGESGRRSTKGTDDQTTVVAKEVKLAGASKEVRSDR